MTTVNWGIRVISEEITRALKAEGTDLFATLPCEKVSSLIDQVSANFKHVALASEEEGVGVCAGASLAGAKPAMIIQSSGVGRIVNALCSLTKVYEFPLLLFVSWRGVYKEAIPAQVPLGQRLPKILDAIDIDYNTVEKEADIGIVKKIAHEVYANNKGHAILLNPKIWESEKAGTTRPTTRIHEKPRVSMSQETGDLARQLTRFEVLESIAPYLDGKIVVCNLGIPCKELYRAKHQKSNFYMLGSMGLASSIGLGVALSTEKDVVVIDGDGSLLMNLGTLSTIALAKPKNLTIVAIDNGVHGSTGNQATAACYGVDLELIAKGSGFTNTHKVASREEIVSTIHNLRPGPNFIHVIAKPGNADVSNIPLSPQEIKQNVMEAIQG